MMKTAALLLSALSLTAVTAPAQDDEEGGLLGGDIPLGVEAVTGYRSEYIDRGFKLAGDLFDFQAESEIALDDEWLVNLGGWFASEVGSGSFEETAAFAGIRRETEKLTLGLELTWRNVRHAVFDDGLDIAPYFMWHFNEDFGVTTGLAWNTGADGLYGFVETAWSKALDTSSFVTATAGLSAVEDYYDRSGLNDLYARLSYTYAINRSVAVTPFAETSLPLASHGESIRVVGGVWFEVNF